MNGKGSMSYSCKSEELFGGFLPVSPLNITCYMITTKYRM